MTQNFDFINYKELSWYKYLTSPQRMLVNIAVTLFLREQKLDDDFSDYSYIVFSMSKAYEGFLKKYLYDLKLITKKSLESHRFRIGRSINPDVMPRHRDEFWLYDDLEKKCGKDMARLLWDTWLECRNQIFHYYPRNEKFLNLVEAGEHLEMMMDTMHQAVDCKLDELKFNENEIINLKK